MPKDIGVPTTRGLKDAAVDYAYGAGGGVVYSLLSNLFGTGLIGGLATAALAGSIIKGSKGEILATMIGFNSIVASMSGAISGGDAGGSQEVM